MRVQITWMGESGFLIEDQTTALLIDPYFSDALGNRCADRHRLLPVRKEWLEKRYDLVLLTHCHIDHTDPETIRTLLNGQPELNIAGPVSSHRVLSFAPRYFELAEGACITIGAFSIRALPAIHSDSAALGYEIGHDGSRLYFSGDTALLCDLQKRVPQHPDVAFLCFNGGVGKNMDMADAAKLADLIGARLVIPFHYGLIPSDVKPQKLEQLLKEKGIPCFIPDYGEPFDIE